MKRTTLILLAAVLMTTSTLVSLAAQKPSRKKASSQAASSSAPASVPIKWATSCTVNVDASQTQGEISKMLMGFNTVAQAEPDALWKNSKLDEQLKEIKCGLLRWPGGEVTSYYHWNDMINKRETDTWDPKYKAEKVDRSQFMDLEEYMGHVRAIGCEPMIGINLESGAKYGRDKEGLEEAKALIQHCVDKKYNVKYWFLDNETYIGVTSNHLRMSAEKYAEYCNRYAEVLRSVDPNIQLVANWAGGWNPDWQKILPIAGKNINIADFHFYWRNSGSSWDYWLTHPMGMAKKMGTPSFQAIAPNDSYEEAVNTFREYTKKAGYDIKIASHEWNVGPAPKEPLSQYQTALMEAEEFGQFINSGMFMSCLWPMHWNSANEYRTLFDDKTGKPHPNYKMFKMYSDAMGQNLLASSATAQEIRPVAAQSTDGKTMYLYLLRKSGDAPALPTSIELKGFAPKTVKALCFQSSDLKSNEADVTELPVNTGAMLSLDLPAHSFTEVILSK